MNDRLAMGSWCSGRKTLGGLQRHHTEGHTTTIVANQKPGMATPMMAKLRAMFVPQAVQLRLLAEALLGGQDHNRIRWQ